MSSIDLKTLKGVLNADGPLLVDEAVVFEDAVRALADAYGGELGSPKFLVWADYVWFQSDEGSVVCRGDGDGAGVARRMSYPVEPMNPGALIDLALFSSEADTL